MAPSEFAWALYAAIGGVWAHYHISKGGSYPSGYEEQDS